MSLFGDLIDALETKWRLANLSPTAMPAGAEGFTRGESIGQELPDSKLPHVFAINPSAQVARAVHGQERVTVSLPFELWVPRDETQENVSARADAMRALLLADPTLGSLSGTWGRAVEAWISFFGIHDPTHGRTDRWAAFTVSVVVEA